jgi:hypothetical protein
MYGDCNMAGQVIIREDPKLFKGLKMGTNGTNT